MSDNLNNCIVYRHIRLDRNEPFYIGIAKSDKRPYENRPSRRSNAWINISKKTDYEVEILFENVSWEFAKQKEKEFISMYGRIDKGTGTLCNMTDGGDGACGQFQSEETKKKRGLAISGEKHGMYGKTHSDELKKRWSESRAGRNHPRAKMVINQDTGDVYLCAKEVSKKYGIKYSTLICWLNGSRINNSPFKFL